jgi:hypothetical protein
MNCASYKLGEFKPLQEISTLSIDVGAIIVPSNWEEDSLHHHSPIWNA